MDKLASYSSDTESEQFEISSPNRAKTELSSKNAEKRQVDLAAEWESFEKLIAGNGTEDDTNKGTAPSGVPAPVTIPNSVTKPEDVTSQDKGQTLSSDSVTKEPIKPSTRKRSLSTDSSESESESESEDSSDGSSESSVESSASDEPKSKKSRRSSTNSDKHESSSSEEESDEDSSEEGSGDSDATSEDEYRQKKSSADDDYVSPKGKDDSKKGTESASHTKAETSSIGRRRSGSCSRTRRSRSHDKHRSSHRDHKKHDRSRMRKHHRRHSRHRSHRSQSRDRRHRSRSRTKSHRRRRSRSRERSKRSSHHHSRSRSRDRHARSRRHSRDRHQKRRSPPNMKPVRRKPLTYKEVLRQKLIEAQHQAAEGKLEYDPSGGKDLMSTNEKPSPLPLMSINPLMSLATGPPGGEKVTPQQALMQTMAAMHQKAQELTGVAVPKYYNPAAVNPLKFAEQVKKRKLLWSKKDSKSEAEAAEAAHKEAMSRAASTSDGQKSSANQWKSTAFLEDKDGRMAAKFRKLMGIKDPDDSGANANDTATEETIKRQQELFNHLDREYQFARMTTHTHRGIGLGFTSQMYPDMK